MNQEKKVNEMARRIGMVLINSGTNMLRSAYDLKPKVYIASQIQNKLVEILRIPANQISCADAKIQVVDWNTWEWIKDLDLIDSLQYYSDVFDCDNFAFAFASRATSFYLLNSCAVGFGKLYNDKGEWIGNHAFNIIAVDEGNGLGFIIYEPMNDGWGKMTNKRTRLDFGWTYEPSWIIFF